MGKGDRKTKKGKLWRGSHGKRRPKKPGNDTPPDAKKQGKKKK